MTFSASRKLPPKPLARTAASRWCWSPPVLWSMSTAGFCSPAGRRARRWPACGNSPAASSNPGETPEAALIRELKEELGIDVAAACLAPFAFASHDYETVPSSDAAVHLPPLERHPAPLGRVRRSPGCGATKLAEYEMPPADKPLIPLLREFL